MMDMGYPLHLIDLLAKLYKKELAKVKVAGTLSEWFRVKKGVRQGYVLSPYCSTSMPGALRRGRPRTAWMDNIKTWTGLSVEESDRTGFLSLLILTSRAAEANGPDGPRSVHFLAPVSRPYLRPAHLTYYIIEVLHSHCDVLTSTCI